MRPAVPNFSTTNDTKLHSGICQPEAVKCWSLRHSDFRLTSDAMIKEAKQRDFLVVLLIQTAELQPRQDHRILRNCCCTVFVSLSDRARSL